MLFSEMALVYNIAALKGLLTPGYVSELSTFCGMVTSYHKLLLRIPIEMATSFTLLNKRKCSVAAREKELDEAIR